MQIDPFGATLTARTHTPRLACRTADIACQAVKQRQLQSVTLIRVARGVAVGCLTAASAPSLGAALTRQFVSGHASGRLGAMACPATGSAWRAGGRSAHVRVGARPFVQDAHPYGARH